MNNSMNNLYTHVAEQFSEPYDYVVLLDIIYVFESDRIFRPSLIFVMGQFEHILFSENKCPPSEAAFPAFFQRSPHQGPV